MGHSKSSSKKEVYSNIILSQETRKIPNKQPNLTPKATREKRKILYKALLTRLTANFSKAVADEKRKYNNILQCMKKKIIIDIDD